MDEEENVEDGFLMSDDLDLEDEAGIIVEDDEPESTPDDNFH
ncbi:MAG: hypothetical protein WAV15_02200 [Minisyncoccia bacterium]